VTIPFFAFPYKVRSAVPGWRGWRLVWYGFALREPCQFWRWHVSEGTPLCDPTSSCRCCKVSRERGAHTHTCLTSGSRALGLNRSRTP
jgi:hypothetical protein